MDPDNEIFITAQQSDFSQDEEYLTNGFNTIHTLQDARMNIDV